MKGKEFIARVSKYAKANGLGFSVDRRRGKGGHVMVNLEGRKSVVKTGEIGKGLLNAMLRQLGIRKEDF